MKLKTIAIFAAGMLCQAILSRRFFHADPPKALCPPPPSPQAVAQLAPPAPTPLPGPRRRHPRAQTARREEIPETSENRAPEAEVSDDRVCPESASEYHFSHPSEESLSCRCSLQAAETGPVWGTGIYTADSSICRAAKQSGIWRYDGDEVTLYFKPGQSHYQSSEEYGVRSEDYGPWESSFAFSP